MTIIQKQKKSLNFYCVHCNSIPILILSIFWERRQDLLLKHRSQVYSHHGGVFSSVSVSRALRNSPETFFLTSVHTFSWHFPATAGWWFNFDTLTCPQREHTAFSPLTSSSVPFMFDFLTPVVGTSVLGCPILSGARG